MAQHARALIFKNHSHTHTLSLSLLGICIQHLQRGNKVANDANGETAAEASDGAGDGAGVGAGDRSRWWARTHHPTCGLRWTGPCSVKTGDYARARVFVTAQLIHMSLLKILPRRAPRTAGQSECRTPHPAAMRS